MGALLYRSLATAVYCSALFLGGCCVNIVGPAGPTLSHTLHASVTMIGNVFAAEGAGNTIGSSLVAPLLERYSGHSILSCLCLILFFVVGLVPSCTSFLHVVGLYVIVGCCLGLLNGSAQTLVTWLHTGHNVGPWVNLINASFGLGASCAPLVFVAAERRMGNGLVAFSVIGAFASVPALAASLLQSPQQPHAAPRSELHQAEEDEWDRHPLRKVHSIRHGGSSIAGVDLGSRAAYLRVTVFGPLMAAITLGIGSEIAFAGWIYTYATEHSAMRRATAAYLNSLFWSTFTAGRVCTIPLAAYVSPGGLLLPTLLLELASLLLIATIPASESALWLGTVGAGIGYCALYSNIISLLASYALLTPSTVSAMGMAAALGHMVIPNFVGLAIHTGGLGYGALIWICLVNNAVSFGCVCSVVFHLRHNFTPTPDSVQGMQLLKVRQAELEAAAEGRLAESI